MSRSHRYSSVEKLSAKISFLGHNLDFQLCVRPLLLGENLKIEYYWMDASAFRIKQKKRASDHDNFQNCITHWLLAMRAHGHEQDPDQRRQLLLASSYFLFSGNKSQQAVYLDAFLGPDATNPESHSLSDAVGHHINEVVHAQDAERVRLELDEVLLGPEFRHLCESDCVWLRPMWDAFLNHGLDLMSQRGNSGMGEFLGKLDAWSARHRKKCPTWIRTFLNVLAYESKACFNGCYANSWSALIPWLCEHHNLDRVSERFLRFWHMRNHHKEQADGSIIPDAFCGQVLSLHPLSGFFMKDRALCAVAGKFFGSDACDRVMAAGHATDCKEYWNLIGAILTAAHLYRQAHDEQKQQRGVRQRATDVGECAAATSGDDRSYANLIQEYLDAKNESCADCQAGLQFQQFHPVDPRAKSFEIESKCPQCKRVASLFVDSAEFADWIISR